MEVSIDGSPVDSSAILGWLPVAQVGDRNWQRQHPEKHVSNIAFVPPLRHYAACASVLTNHDHFCSGQHSGAQKYRRHPIRRELRPQR